jgi:3-hydroxyisobutyrate dehydrogenase
MSEGRVGFIGLGNMGGRMSRCLLQKGRAVVGFDIRSENVAAAGVEPASSIGGVVAKADVVLLSLPDSRVVEAVVLGPEGILAHARAGLIVVDLSTSAPTSTRMIHDRLAEAGVPYLDAGISGGAAAAETATLTLMVGGDKQHLDTVHAVLNCFATNIFHLGGTGAGHTAKVLNNFLNAVTLAATAEVMVAGKKAVLELGVLLDVLNTSSGASYATAKRFPKIIHGDYMKGGLSNTLMMKDVTLYSQLVGQLGMTSLNATGPTASFGLAIALGYADEISNKVVDAIGDISGGVRLHTDNSEEMKSK